MTTLDTLTFITFYLVGVALVYLFLLGVHVIWESLHQIGNDEAAERQVMRGESTEQVEAMWRGR